jgi:hypothetical protein
MNESPADVAAQLAPPTRLNRDVANLARKHVIWGMQTAKIPGSSGLATLWG